MHSISRTAQAPIVPKKVFFFWGVQKMSWLRYMTLHSFRKLNPDWEMWLYLYDTPIKYQNWSTIEKQDFFFYDGDDYLRQACLIPDLNVVDWKGYEGHTITGPSHQSNFFKWYMLATQGGVYADMDILWIKPFDAFYEVACTHNVSICLSRGSFHIGLLAASPDNPFFRDVLTTCGRSFDPDRYQSAGVENLYRHFHCNFGDARLPQRVAHRYPELSFYDIPKPLIYPWAWDEMDRVFTQRHGLPQPDDTIAIHWYAGTELAQKWNKILTEEYVRKHKASNTISYCAEGVL